MRGELTTSEGIKGGIDRVITIPAVTVVNDREAMRGEYVAVTDMKTDDPAVVHHPVERHTTQETSVTTGTEDDKGFNQLVSRLQVLLRQ